MKSKDKDKASRGQDSYSSDKSGSTGWVAFFRIFSYADAISCTLYAIAFACMVVSGTALPLLDIVFGKLVTVFNDYSVERVSSDDFSSEVSDKALLLVYLFVAKFVVFYIGMLSITIAAARTTRALRLDFVQKTLRQEIGYFDTDELGSVAMQVTTSGNLVHLGIADKLGLVVQAISALITAFIVAIVVQWKLALITICIVPAIIVATGIAMTFDSKVERTVLRLYSEAGNIATEAISNIKLVHAYWAQPKMIKSYNEKLDEARTFGMKKSIIWGIWFSWEFFCTLSGYALALWQGIRMITSGEITSPGDVITVIFAVLVAASSVTAVAPQITAISKAASAAENLFRTIDRQSLLDPLAATGLRPKSVAGEIDLSSVDFAYPSRPDTQVLHGLSLNIPANSTTALVGASGSGKSTIVGLLERWYEYAAGTIKIDGIDIRQLDVQWLRTNIRFVQQEPVLFNGSIFQNVLNGLVGAMDVTESDQMSRVVEACKAANADGFIRMLPQGYQTIVGERGGTLSGGQKQRIAIARSIVSNPKILLLDEATSALDPEAEKEVQRALERLRGTRTTVIIAHKLSTIRLADNIAVIDHGVITEQGTHAELIAAKGAYYRLVVAQDLGNIEDPAEDLSTSDHYPHQTEIPPSIVHRAAEEDQMIPVAPEHDETRQALAYGILRSLMIFVREQSGDLLNLVAILLACIIGGLTYPALAVIVTKVIDAFELEGQELQDRGDLLALMLFVVALVNLVSYFVMGVCMNIVYQNLSRRYREEMFTKMLYQDMEYFDMKANGTGALVARLSSVPTLIQELMGNNIALIAIGIVNLVSSCILALAIGWKLALVVIFGGLLPILASGILRFKMELRLEHQSESSFSQSAALASEAVSAIRTVASLALERHIIDRYRSEMDGIVWRSIGMLWWSNLLFAFGQAVEFAVQALAFWYGARLLAEGEYSQGMFFSVFLSILFAAEASVQLVAYSASVTKAHFGANQLLWLRTHQPRVGPHEYCRDTAAMEKDNERSALEVKELKFAYRARSNDPVLRGIDLQVRDGEFVAFVGASGCGKSTMISLIERFYELDSGKIEYHGRDITSLCPREYRNRLAYVQQEPTLFQGSIRENIFLRTDRPPLEKEIQEVCEQANLWEFISSLPEGLNTRCGAGGAQLSGGQRQRVAIARALIRKPDILLLDEATSALDTESEKLVQRAIEKASTGKTTVAIAHRLSTIKDADKIFVFYRGKVAEVGTHAELQSRRGIYYKMCQSQSLA